MRAARRDHYESIRHRYARPCSGQAFQAARLIVEVDAVFGPCGAPIHQDELSSLERMEWMSYAKALYVIDRIECS